MMRISLLFVVVLMSASIVYSQDVILKNDNGKASTGGYSNVWMMEETKLLMPDGPCSVKEIQIYFHGNSPHKDTIYIVGDPAEGSIAPTFWCLNYNMKIPPIYFDYPGTPGWYKFQVNDLHLDGLDRLVVQHRVQPNGPWFATDNDGLSANPYTSYLMNPFENNSLGGPGRYYIPRGDFMVRALIEYDLPDGESSEQAPPPVMFDVTKAAGLVDGNGDPIKHNEVSVQDINGDGWDDIVIKSFVFINKKDGTFEYSDAIKEFSSGMTSWADFDNDGDLDFYSLRNGPFNAEINMVVSRDRLIENLGNMQFRELAPKSSFNLPYPSPGKDFQMPNQYEQDSIFNPYSCITALWTDYDNDGRLDLYLANNRKGFNVNNQYNERYFPDQLWHQKDDGTFENVTDEAGISAAEPFSKQNNTWYGFYDCYGANATDFNNDGRADIFVANYRLVKDNLYMNNGDGTMTDVAATTGVQGEPTAVSYYFGHGMGAEWADFNNDGNMDLCVGNLGHPDWRAMYSNPSLIYRNDGPPNYHFTEVHGSMGLKFFEMNAGVLWADFDLDGYQDLWHGQISYVAQSNTAPMRPGLLYMNQGPPDYKLRDMTWYYGCALHGPWSAARIDYDNDGDLDLIVCSRFDGVRLFRNDLKKKGDWIAFRLIGNPQASVPLNAFGTKVIVYAGGKMFMRELNSIAGTRMTQNSNELHFGLGEIGADEVDSVLVIYPSDKRHKIEKLAKNSRYIIPYMGSPVTNGIPTPQLIAPQNFVFGLDNDIDMKWGEILLSESYDIEIFGDEQLQDEIYSGNIKDNKFSLTNLEDNHTYYWRVRAIGAGDTSSWSSLWNFTVGKLIPNPPALRSPANGAENIKLNPLFTWEAATYDGFYSPKTGYHIQISEKSDFSAGVIEYDGIFDLKIQLQDTLKDNVKYYWRVRGNNQGAYGQWSEVWTFTTMSLPAAPALVEPPDGAKDVSLKPRFEWQEVEEAKNYHLQIAYDADFTDIFYEMKSLVQNYLKLFKKLNSGETYYWRVRSKKDGYAGNWSEVWSFTVQEATTVEDTKTSAVHISVVPNPVFGDAQVNVYLPENMRAQIVVYDLLGRKIKILDERMFTKGEYKYVLQKNDFEEGIYFVYLIGENIRRSKSIVILK